MLEKIVGQFILLYAVICFNQNVETSRELVTTNNGILRGEKRADYYAFEGVRYAEPPVEKNRFEVPVSISSCWDGIQDATKPGPSCMQWDNLIFAKNRLRGEEDCLFLNIYRPVKRSKNGGKFPVVFFIHGGAFMFGNGDFYGPDILLQRQMILITINYRLGPLGFLSTEDGIVPGNMGLKDQSMALRWVQENIEFFGGDQSKVTITGFSAGGASVHLHYLSKLSDNLFQNGISHSGCALNPWVFTEKPLSKAKKLAKHVNCTTKSNKLMIKCLKTRSASEIVTSVQHFMPFIYNPFTTFGAVVESVNSKTPFLIEEPLTLIKKGHIYPKPWLVSAVDAEGLYPAFELLRNKSAFADLENNWDEYGSAILHLVDTVSNRDRGRIMKEIKKHYFGNKTISFETFPALVKMVTDYSYVIGIQRSVKLQSKYGKAPVYIYFSRFHSSYGLEQALTGHDDFDFGVSHGDDVFMIYNNTMRNEEHPYTKDEIEIQSKLVDMYFHFAEHRQLGFGDVKFEQAVHDNDNLFKYLNIVGPEEYYFENTDDLAEATFWRKYDFY